MERSTTPKGSLGSPLDSLLHRLLGPSTGPQTLDWHGTRTRNRTVQIDPPEQRPVWVGTLNHPPTLGRVLSVNTEYQVPGVHQEEMVPDHRKRHKKVFSTHQGTKSTVPTRGLEISRRNTRSATQDGIWDFPQRGW